MRKAPFFRLDLGACSGCKTCMMACLDGRGDNIDRPRRRVWECLGGSWKKGPEGTYAQDIVCYYISLGCQHCQDPPCLEACPQGAIAKGHNGLVLLKGHCLGCRSCLLACPYEAPVYDKKSGQLDKCDFCQERLDEGLQPYCVAACPMRALSLSWEWDEKLDCEHPAPLPAKRLLGPRLMIIAHPIIAQKLKGAKNKEPIEIVKANPEEI